MDPEQIQQDVQDLQDLARRLTKRLDDFSDAETAALANVLPDLAPLFQKFRSPGLHTGELVARAHQTHIEDELRRLSVENRRQNALLEAVFAADPGGVAVVSGPVLHFVYANPTYRYICPTLGIDPTGLLYSDIWPKENDGAFQEQIENVLKTGRPYQYLGYERHYPDGSKHTFTFQARRIEWENELAALIILWDTTEMTQAQNQMMRLLQETHHQAEEMEGVFNAMNDAVIIYDTQGTVMHANPAIIQIMGFDPTGKKRDEIAAQMINRRPDGQRLNANDLPSVRALSGERVTAEPLQVTNAAGQTFSLQMTANLLYNAEQQVNGVVVVWHDVTEQEQSQHALRVSEERFRSSVESLLDGFAILSAIRNPQTSRPGKAARGRFQSAKRSAGEIVDFRYEFINQKGCQLIGRSYEALVGHTQKSLEPTLFNATTFKMAVQVTESGKPLEYEDITYQEDQRLRLAYEVRAYKLGDGVVITWRDITARKQMEEQLRASETAMRASETHMRAALSRMQSVFDSRIIGVVIGDVEGNVTEANDYYLELLGYTQAELVSGLVDWRIATPAEHLPADYRAIEEVNARGTCAPYEKEYRRKDGSRVWVLISLARLPGTEDQIAGCVLNITRHKQAEISRMASEERERNRVNELEAIMDAVPAMLWIARDPLCQEMTGNRYGYEFLKMWEGANISKTASETDLDRQPYRTFKEGREIPIDQLPMQIAAAQGTPARDYEFDLVFNDQTTRTVLGNVEPLRTPDGKPCGAVGAFIDITARKQAEAALAASEAKYRELADSITDPFTAYDANLRLIYRNRAAGQATLIPDEQAIGKTFAELYPDLGGGEIHQAYLRALETHEPQHYLSRWVRPQDGHVFYYDLNVYPSQEGVVAISRDITERIEAEQRAATEQEWFRTTLASIGDAVITTDARGAVTFLNEVAEQLTGWSSAEAAGQPLEVIFHIINEQTRQPAENPVGKVLERGLIVGLANHTALVARDGSCIPIEDSAAPIKDSAGQILGVVMVFHNVGERRRAETERDRLLAENRRQRELLEAQSFVDPGGQALVTGEELVFQYVNPAYRGLTLHPEIDPLGRPYDAIWPPEEGFTQRAMIQQAMRDGKDVHFLRHERRMPDGTTHYFTFHIHPIQSDGQPAAYLVLWDTTEIVQAEAALLNSEEKYRTTLASIGDAVITTDNTGKVTYLNPVAERLTGWSSAEAGGQPLERVFPIVNEQTRQPVENPAGRVLECGAVVGLANHTALVSRDGRFIPIEDSAAPIKNAAGVTLGVVMVFHDVTERRKAEAALQESQALIHAVMDNTPDLIFMKDRESRLLLANPATLELIGKPADQVMGKTDAEFYDDPEVGYTIMENDRLVMETGQTQVVEERVANQGGDLEGSALKGGALKGERFFLSTKSPYRDAEGKIIGVIGVSRDITERKERERELDKLNRTLQALNKSNQAMLRAEDDSLFMQEVCRIITQDCGYAMVWIGFAEQDAEKSVRPVAYSGFESGYLEQLHVTWADTERGRGPTGTAIRTGKIAMCRNMQTDPAFAPWREAAIKRGYASSLVLPMMDEDRAFGAITIYARQPEAFSDDEVKLLTELAGDLAYGITALSLRRANAQAAEALRVSEERYRSLFDGMTEGFALHELICDVNGQPCDYRFLEINPAFERLTGLTQAEVKGKLKSQIEKLRGDDPKWIEIYGNVALTGEPVHFENYSPPLQMYYELYAYCPAPGLFAVIFTNITGRKQAEYDLLRAREATEKNKIQIEVQRRLIEQREQERLQVARDLHDGPVQTLTGASFNLQAIEAACEDPQTAGDLKQVRDSLIETIGELRNYAQDLRPPALFRFGLRTAVQSYLETFRERHPELRVHLTASWSGPLLAEPTNLALFRIFQESLNNVVRHAHASDVWINMIRDTSQIILEIEDNGAGFTMPEDPLRLARQGHLGLVGIRERAEAIGGIFEIDTRPGKGTRIQVVVGL